jgi:hypothetical protein
VAKLRVEERRPDSWDDLPSRIARGIVDAVVEQRYPDPAAGEAGGPLDRHGDGHAKRTHEATRAPVEGRAHRV